LLVDADQVPVRIECAQQPRLVGPHVGLNGFNASSVTKNAASMVLSYPQKRTARRVASKARLLLGKLSGIVDFEPLSWRR
jgi:hypothetical protein